MTRTKIIMFIYSKTKCYCKCNVNQSKKSEIIAWKRTVSKKITNIALLFQDWYL